MYNRVPHKANDREKEIMIKYYYKTAKEKQMASFERFKKNSWIYVENPTMEEKDLLINQFKVDASLLQDAEDINEVPRFEIEDKTLYLFTRFAFSSGDIIDTTPMLIILTNESLITIANTRFSRLDRFISGKVDFNTLNRNLLLTKILMQINETYDSYLNNISKKLRIFSTQVQKIRNKDIIQFVNTENVLYDFNTALVRLEAIYNSMLSKKILKLSEEEKDFFEDAALASSQLIQITRESLRTMVNIREAYSTIMTNNLNRVIKLFTSLTVILTLPTIIGTFYGMNVRLPLSDNPLAFYYIVGITTVFSLVTIYIFVRNDWL